MGRTGQTVNSVVGREERGKQVQRGVRWEETPTVVGRGRQGQAYSEGNEPETVMDGGMRQEKGRDERMTEENRRLGNKTSSIEKGKWSEDEVREMVEGVRMRFDTEQEPSRQRYGGEEMGIVWKNTVMYDFLQNEYEVAGEGGQMATWETHEVLEELSDIEEEWDVHEGNGVTVTNNALAEIEDFVDECVAWDEMELSSRAGIYGQRALEDSYTSV